MRCRHLLPAILMTLSLLIQGCSTPTVKYVQAYHDRNLSESEIAWIAIGEQYDENGKRLYSGVLQVMFDRIPQTRPFSSRPGVTYYAFPAGDHTFRAKGSFVNASTGWVEITESFEGGKCYEIRDTRDGSAWPRSATHTFKVVESSCSRWFRGHRAVELYKLVGYTPELVKSYDTDDAVFSSLKNKNNANITTIPFEFVRKLYEESE